MERPEPRVFVMTRSDKQFAAQPYTLNSDLYKLEVHFGPITRIPQICGAWSSPGSCSFSALDNLEGTCRSQTVSQHFSVWWSRSPVASLHLRSCTGERNRGSVCLTKGPDAKEKGHLKMM